MLRDPVLLAVSGGSDSLALLMLAQEAGLNCHVVTVDHGLRAEAADETAYVGSLCRQLGVPHTIQAVRWATGEVPSQSRARTHRYRLLSNTARTIGARLILAGHTEDDQAETICLRQRAGSDDWGLAGMQAFAPIPVWPEGYDLFLGRPLLDQRREALRALLRDKAVAWCDDPSNENVAYQRVEIRQMLSGEPDIYQSMLSKQRQSAEKRQRMASDLRLFLAGAVRWMPGGGIMMDRQAFGALSHDLRYRLLALLLPCIAGRQALPRRSALEELLQDKFHSPRTLAGARIEALGTQIMITPEIDASETTQITSGQSVWQGRVLFEFKHLTDTTLRIAAWGDRTVPSDLKMAKDLPFKMRKALPVLLDEAGQLLSVPHLQPQRGLDVTDLAEKRLNIWLDAESELQGVEIGS